MNTLKKALQRNMLPGTKSIIVYLIAIVVVGIAVYSNSLYNQFVWDDFGLVVNDLHIRGWSNLPDIFSGCMGGGNTETWFLKWLIYYRPLQTITYIFDYSLWHMNAGGFHISNILLHILAAIALYFLIRILTGDDLLSFFSSILFTISPLNTETVNYISGRSDSLSLFFTSLSFIFYVKLLCTRRRGFYVSMLISYALALLAKENSIVLIPILAAWHYIFNEKFRKLPYLLLSAMALLYIAARIFFIPHPDVVVLSPNEMLSRVPGFFVAITNYLCLLFFPINLHVDYGQSLFSLFEPMAVTGLISTIFLLYYAFTLKERDRAVSFVICWFFLFLLPTSNVVYPLPFYMAEHFLYAPAVAFFLLLGRWLAALYRSKKNALILKIFIASLLIAYGSITFRQNDYWTNSIRLFEQTLKYNKRSIIAYNNLGVAYLDAGMPEKAIAYFREGCILNPGLDSFYNNMGCAYMAMDNKEAALRWYTEGLKVNPDYPPLNAGLAAAFMSMDKKRQAIDVYKRMLEIDPGYSQAYSCLVGACLSEGRYRLAARYYWEAVSRGIDMDPGLLRRIKSYEN